ncbi:hypothetical protein [Hyphomonas sp.]|uniref:hypothetical protein n=1 Tax=Hyphomonas sp. TaxID=87 RepID=UPI0030022CE8
MRERFCKCCKGWHELDAWPHNCMPERLGQRSDLAAPMLIRDNIEPVRSMLDGQLYDSKSTLRATYKQAGVVEVGNDSSYTQPDAIKPRTAASEKALKQAIKKDREAAVGKALSRAGLGA